MVEQYQLIDIEIMFLIHVAWVTITYLIRIEDEIDFIYLLLHVGFGSDEKSNGSGSDRPNIN